MIKTLYYTLRLFEQHINDKVFQNMIYYFMRAENSNKVGKQWIN